MLGTMPSSRRRGKPRTAWIDNIKTWTELSVEKAIEWQRTEINGESTSMVWSTFWSRKAKEQSRTLYRGSQTRMGWCLNSRTRWAMQLSSPSLMRIRICAFRWYKGRCAWLTLNGPKYYAISKVTTIGLCQLQWPTFYILITHNQVIVPINVDSGSTPCPEKKATLFSTITLASLGGFS